MSAKNEREQTQKKKRAPDTSEFSAEIGYYLYKKCKQIIFYQRKISIIPKVLSSGYYSHLKYVGIFHLPHEWQPGHSMTSSASDTFAFLHSRPPMLHWSIYKKSQHNFFRTKIAHGCTCNKNLWAASKKLLLLTELLRINILYWGQHKKFKTIF